MNNKTRSSNLELLRIILILMIITLHYFHANIGGLFGNVETNTLNYYISHFIEALCICAVNTFIIITGYFSYKKESIKIAKVLKLIFLMAFYGLLIAIIYIICTHTPLSINTLKIVFVSTFSRWFVIIYTILYLLIPFINKLINNLDEKQLKTLLIINFFVFYFLYTFINKATMVDKGYGIVNFINLYLIGAYIRKYKDQPIKKAYCFIVYLVCAIFTTIFSFFAGRAYDYATVFNLIGAIALFCLFKEIKIKDSKFINKLSSYTFAVYIIHENKLFSQFLYRNIFHTQLYWNNNMMILHLIISVIGIYLLCVLIESIRSILLKRICDDNIEKISYTIK